MHPIGLKKKLTVDDLHLMSWTTIFLLSGFSSSVSDTSGLW